MTCKQLHRRFAVGMAALLGAGICLASNPAAVTVDVPGFVRKDEVLKVKVTTEGGSEGVWLWVTGLVMRRGYFDHCGFCGKPCLVNDQVQACPSAPDGCCFNYYCLGCGYSSSHEFSNRWYGGPTLEFDVVSCGEATVQAEYYGGSHQGPFLLPEQKVIVLDGIEAAFNASPVEACIGETIEFDGTPSCGGTSFQWLFGDGSSASGEVVEHAYDTWGAHIVTLNVDDSYSFDSTSHTVTVFEECASLSGTVTNAFGGEPLGGVLVDVVSDQVSRSTVTAADGTYSVSLVPYNTYNVTASRPGFLDGTAGPYVVTPGDALQRDFVLVPEPPEPYDPLTDVGDQPTNVDDPVNPATGNFYLTKRLFVLPGAFGLGVVFDIGYNSLTGDSDGPLGHGWTHRYNVFLEQTGGEHVLALGDGARMFFAYDAGSGVYEPVRCRPAGTLSDRDPDGWVYTLPGGVAYELDAHGRLERLVSPAGAALTFTHSTQLDRITDTAGREIDLTYVGGRLATISSTAFGGNVATFAYDGAGNLTGITDARNGSWGFAYDGAHRMLTVTDRRGIQVTANTYDGSGRVVEQVDAAGHATTYAATPVGDGLEVVITPPSGNAVTHLYDEANRRISTTDGEGFTATMAYTSDGVLASASDKMGRVATFTTSADGSLESFTDRLGRTTTFNHDEAGQLTSIEDETGLFEHFSWDDSGRLRRLDLPDGGSVRIDPDGSGQLYRMHDLRGRWWQFNRNADGTIDSIVDPDDATTSYQYDAAGRVTRIELPDGLGAVEMTWDANGNMLTRTSPGGEVTTYSYDAEDNVTSHTYEPMAATTTYEYDALQRLVKVTDPLGGETTYTYDDDSNPLTVTDADGITVEYVYNRRNQLVAVEHANGSRTVLDYDPNGRLTAFTDPLGQSWSWSWDAEGQLLSTTDPNGATTRLSRDASGRDINVTNAIDETTIVRNGALGDLETLRFDDGSTIERRHNLAGGLQRFTDARGTTWRYAYDAPGRIASVTGPDGLAERYRYDGAGRLVELELRDGGVIQYAYDLDSRLVEMTLPDGSTTTLAYQVDASGTTMTVTEAIGTTVVEYDTLGRFVGKTDPFGNAVAITYTPASRIAAVTTPGGRVVTYQHDGAGRLERITDWVGRQTDLEYDALDRLTRVELPNGTATTYAYDAVGNLTELRNEAPGGGDLLGYTFTRDLLGRISTMTATGGPPVDLADSRSNAAYDASNRTVYRTDDLLTSSFAFDDNGRQILKTTAGEHTVYDYDDLGRLTAVFSGGEQTASSYDWSGTRVRRAHAGDERRYLARGNLLWATFDGSGALERTFISGPGILYSVDTTGDISVYHSDPRGSVVAMSDGAGSVVASYAYDPYGRTVASTGSGDNELRFLGTLGVVADPNGLYRTGARYYDAAARRFLTEDPAGLAASTNLYAWSGGDPVNRADPSGLQDGAITWTAEVIAAVETWLQRGYELGLRDPGELVPSGSFKVGEVYVTENLVTGHLSQNYPRDQAVNLIVNTVKKERELAGGEIHVKLPKLTTPSTGPPPVPPASNPTTPLPTSNPTTQLPSNPTSQLPKSPPPPSSPGVTPNSSGGGTQNRGFLNRLYNGVRNGGRELLSTLGLYYTTAKILLSSDAATVSAMGSPEAVVLLPAASGYVSARATSAYVPVTYNQVTGKWETGDQVVTTYFLPGQIAKYQPIEDPVIWFRQFLESIGMSYDDYLKIAAEFD